MKPQLTYLSHLRRMAHGYRLQIVLNTMLGVCDVATGLAEVWLTKRIVDGATAGQSWHLADGGWQSLPALSLMLVGCLLLSVTLAYAVRWLRATLGIRAQNNLQAGEYASMMGMPWVQLRKQHSGTLSNTLIEDVATISSFLSEQFPALVTAVLQFVGAFVFLCVMDWRLALVVIVVTPVLIIVAQAYIRLLRRYRHELRQEQADIQAYLQETLQHSLWLKAFDRTRLASSLLGEHHRSLERTYLTATRYNAVAMMFVRLAFVAGYGIAFFWGVYNLSVGAITFGAMVAFVQLVGQIQQPIRSLIGYVGTFVSVSTAVERIEQSHNRQPQPCPPRKGVTGGGAGCRSITFTYPDSEEPVFTHLSVDIPKGAFVAVVGKTGIGKTTFVQLLLGLLKPDEGSIVVPERGFAYVPQGNTLLSGTIRYNLSFGNPAATDAEMTEALRLAEAGFVLDDERGLDYPCGERGGGLSEGQAQRVAIARALLVSADALLLDEAFSALDSATAEAVIRNIRTARPHQTLICVTHREALIAMADKVVRVE